MLEKGLQDLLSELHRGNEREFLTPGEDTNPIPAPEKALRKSALRNAKSKAVAAPPGLAPQSWTRCWCGCCCNSSLGFRWTNFVLSGVLTTRPPG